MITEPSGWHSQQSFPSRVLQRLHQCPQHYPHPSLRGSLWILMTMTTDKKLFIYRCYAQATTGGTILEWPGVRTK